ncbi:MAG: NurA domain-containing protein, partial [Cyanobacteria bacterium J06573_11]
MAIKSSQIQAVLSRKRADFASFDESTSGYLEQYRGAWDEWVTMKKRTQWLKTQEGTLGAIPLEPIDSKHRGILRSNLSWTNREQSLAWAKAQIA